MEVAELFNHLESNQPQIVEEIKKTFHENFNATKESWLVGGLFDYYVNTSSVRCVEILVGVREPHDKHLFDKVLEGMRGAYRLQALTLLGHVVRRQPTWLYKITQHPLMRELLKLLKNETDFLSLMSALLVLIVLLPMIPALIGPFLPDIFEVFSRLAAWKCTNPSKLPEEHLLHLQVGLYALFQRLYGMYPCNFLSYLRHEYSQHANLGTFSHTIKPMLDTVKMHPLLVTHSKDGETTAARWKKMEHHDVILECARFSLDAGSGAATPGPRGRRPTPPAILPPLLPLQPPPTPSPALLGEAMWSPSVHCGFQTPPLQETPATPIPQSHVVSSSLPHQEGTSPPEAAIEATPETTPVKDPRPRHPPVTSAASRALTKWPTTPTPTPSPSQPSSPMKKDAPPFHFPSETTAFERRDSLFHPDPRRDLFLHQKVQKVLQDRNQMSLESPRPLNFPPTSPLRGVPDSPVPMDPTAPSPGGKVSRPTPERNGFRFDPPVLVDSTREDQEVDEIVHRGRDMEIVGRYSGGLLQEKGDIVPSYERKADVGRFSDSVMLEKGDERRREGEIVQRKGDSVGEGRLCDSVLQEGGVTHEEYEECVGGEGVCDLGGLHMPDGRSMLDFARRVALKHRQRFYSQCVTEAASPMEERGGFGQEFAVRRTNSCPEMKKRVAEVECVGTLVEEGETTNGAAREMATMATQTVDHWAPLPYEHLFLEVLPATTQPSSHDAAADRFSPNAMLDQYIDAVARGTRGSSSEAVLREQLFLLSIQLQFERHRREVHAERNRRLLGKSRSTRAMEEHNSALREQLSLLQADFDLLRSEEDRRRKAAMAQEAQAQEALGFWQRQCNTAQREVKDLRNKVAMLEQEVKQAKDHTARVVTDCQDCERRLLSTMNELQQVLKEATDCDRLRGEVARLQRELLLMGELQERCREEAARRPLTRRPDDQEVTLIRECSRAEINALHEMLDSKSSLLEAAKARLAELEAVLSRRDLLLTEQKRSLKQVKEEYHAKLEAVESKCSTQRAINQRMEEQVVYLTNQLEVLERGRILRSPDSSTHEVSVSVSSAGSAVGRLLGASPPVADAFRLAAVTPPSRVVDNVGLKNLQLIVEQSDQSLAAIAQHSADL